MNVSIMKVLYGPISVSYTHLDVYQRQVLGDSSECPHKGCHRLVEGHSQRFGVGQRVGVSGIAAEVSQELFDLARRKHRVAQMRGLSVRIA